MWTIPGGTTSAFCATQSYDAEASGTAEVPEEHPAVKLILVAVGRARDPYAGAVRELERRAQRYWKLDVVEVEAGARGAKDPKLVIAAEERRILGRLPEHSPLVALTRAGQGMRSEEMAAWLGELALQGSPGAAFVVGGAFGLGAEVLARAKKKLSLSKGTLPHELARLVLAEQLYRAGTILRGEPYHKG